MTDVLWSKCPTLLFMSCKDNLQSVSQVWSVMKTRRLDSCTAALWQCTHCSINWDYGRLLDYELSLDYGARFRQAISTHHLEATMGMFTFSVCYVLLCVRCLICWSVVVVAVWWYCGWAKPWTVATLQWSALWDVNSLQTLCWDIGDKSRSWNKTQFYIV